MNQLSKQLAEAVAAEPVDLVAVRTAVEAKLKAPYVSVGGISKLGGATRQSFGVTVSLDPKEKWSNGILENSRYAKFMVWMHDSSIEMISGHGTAKFRKARFKNADDAASKFVKWVASNGAE